ncbi:MAG: N-acetyl sugar amidotransferase [Bernardetiaceae bacterium]|jgi:N-acetyl sugar amidotransferase|nr:N-acetyl sugar amidotransferase [Bernardetiaceae bacterium]
MSATTRAYQICTKTVMDTVGDPDIVFDPAGVCHYYHEFSAKLRIRVPPAPENQRQLDQLVAQIKASGQGKAYDCIIGISGGVDSTYTAWLVKQMGLRPLAVHVDNGWNSELAVKNIENILNKLGIDLYTEVLDWAMFKDLQLSFLKASTPDGEIPTDHAIVAVLYKMAAKFGLKYIVSGMNFRNEGLLPPSWARGYLDWRYIRSVHQRFGSASLASFPHLSVGRFLYYNLAKGIRSVSLINYIDFNKSEAMALIQRELGWQYYGGKHYESIYTRFYQSYILPQKFNIDKRKAHLTCLIIATGEITRDQALAQLQQPPADPDLVAQDKEYVIKKLGIDEAAFEALLQLPVKSILDYPNLHWLEKKFRQWLHRLRKMGLLPN